MTRCFYQFDETTRRRLLADAGFTRDDHRTWSHPDGRSIGEGVAFALADRAFFRFIGTELPESASTAEPQPDPAPLSGSER